MPSSQACARHACVHEADSAQGKGVVEIDDSGMVTGFMEKESQASGRVLINPDVYVLESDIVSPLESGVESYFGRGAFPRAIDRGLPVFAGRLASSMIDTGRPEDLSLGRSTARVSTAVYRTAHS